MKWILLHSRTSNFLGENIRLLPAHVDLQALSCTTMLAVVTTIVIHNNNKNTSNNRLLMLNLRTVGKSLSTCLPYPGLFVHLLSLAPSAAHLQPSTPVPQLWLTPFSGIIYLNYLLLGPADWLELFLPNSYTPIYLSTLMYAHSDS